MASLAESGLTRPSFRVDLPMAVAAASAVALLVWLLSGPTGAAVSSIWSIGIGVGLVWSWALARRRGIWWVRVVAATPDIHLLGLALLFGLAVQHVSSNGITSDGCLYLAHLRSLLFDQDLEIARELEILKLPARPHHIVAIGPGLVWTPLYVAVAVVDWIGRSMGAWTSPSDRALVGLTGPYARAAMLSSYLIAAAGLIALHLRLRREFGRTIAFVASLLLFGATTIVWYAIYEPAMTHAASFGVVALFLVAAEAWMRRAPASPRQAALLGALFGVATVVRPQDALFAVFPVIFVLARVRNGGLRAADVRAATFFVLGAAPLMLLQTVLWMALLARQPFQLAGSGGYLDLISPRLSDVLFSSWHGFLSWTPIAYVAVIGTVFYARRDREWGVAAIILLVAMAWINGSAEDWAGGWAFGGRRFSSALAALAPGLGLALTFAERRPLVLIAPLVALAIQWNYYLMVQYNKGLLPKDEPVQFDTIVRQQVDLLVGERFVYPFAFPGNLLFSWREGVPADRYDVLAPQPWLESKQLRFDASAEPFLLEGWSSVAEDAAGPYRRMLAEDATFVVPLAPPDGRAMVVQIEARLGRDANAPSALLAVTVNGHGIGRTPITTTAGTSEIIVASGNSQTVWRRGYNRVTLKRVEAEGAIAIYGVLIGPHK